MLRVLGGLPLFAYPAVLLASVMLLGTDDPNNPPAALVAVKLAFGWGTVASPLVYFGSLALGERAARRGADRADLAWSAAPLVYLLVLVALAVLWGRLDGTG
ncbi:hypothetical protein F8S09_01340 [Deinococcus sp. SDU3-2]|uniref:Uncharacterized protein n=1 Tax=Deinococcus terrestris TaxID=2651870 RepID=A0A7X1NU15_9DEIO|nr:hypothetical protein [Deinococcus terrestris]MPY65339.1 hypothetical protein [Deinococcus terrestris]